MVKIKVKKNHVIYMQLILTDLGLQAEKLHNTQNADVIQATKIANLGQQYYKKCDVTIFCKESLALLLGPEPISH